MLISTIIMGVVAAILTVLAWIRGGGEHVVGLKSAIAMLVPLLPMLVFAFLTGWALLGVARLPMEVGILGWRLTVARLACTFCFPVLAGFLARICFAWMKLT